jgi:hypothetical protein
MKTIANIIVLDFVEKDQIQYLQEVDVQFLYGFLSWVCDQRRGKGGWRRPGIGHTTLIYIKIIVILIYFKNAFNRLINKLVGHILALYKSKSILYKRPDTRLCIYIASLLLISNLIQWI